jgi:hypothetical protein
MTSKCADYFKLLLESEIKQSKAFVNKVSQWKGSGNKLFNSRTFRPEREGHLVCENLIIPVCKIIVGKMLGQDAVRYIENVPFKQYDK